jgi:hypothetical protein
VQKAHIAVIDLTRNLMLLRSAGVCFAMSLLATLAIAPVRAQDVPGIEICTVEKTMERRTSCLQSNVDFLQKTITKLNLDHQQKLDAAARQIDALKTTVAGLQKTLGDLQAAQAKTAEDAKKKQDAPPPKDAAK